MKKTLSFLHFLEDSSLVTLTLTLLLISILQIIFRNMGIAGLMWADSAMRILVLWLAFLGAMRASRLRSHIAMDLVSHYAPIWLQHILHIIVSLSCGSICAIAAYFSWDFVLEEYQSNITAFLNIPVWLTEAIIPLALSIIALRFFFHTFLFIPSSDEESLQH